MLGRSLWSCQGGLCSKGDKPLIWAVARGSAAIVHHLDSSCGAVFLSALTPARLPRPVSVLSSHARARVASVSIKHVAACHLS